MLAAGTVRVATDTETTTDRVVARIATLRQRGMIPLRRLFTPSTHPCPVSGAEILAQRQRAVAGYTLVELLIALGILALLIAGVAVVVLEVMCMVQYLKS